MDSRALFGPSCAMEWLRALKRRAYEAYEAPVLPCAARLGMLQAARREVDQALSPQHFPHLGVEELRRRQASWSSLLLRFQTLRRAHFHTPRNLPHRAEGVEFPGIL